MNGVYRYFKDGQLLNIRETWTIETNVIRSERDAPDYQAFIGVEAWMDAQGKINRFEVVWKNGSANAVADASALYSIGDTIEIIRRIADEETKLTFPIPEKLVVAPLMRVFMGSTIREIIVLGGKASVLVPDITDPTNRDALLMPKIETRQASPVGDGIYRYTGERYDQDACFWIGEDGFLSRYMWQGWDVRLEG